MRPLPPMTLGALALLAAGLPARAAPASVPLSPHAIYAGLPHGKIYRSSDDGQTWQETDHGLYDTADVDALVVAPDHPGTVYAGTSSAGVFVSTNSGRSWQTDNGDNQNLGNADVVGLAMDPTQTSRLFAATTDDLVYSTEDGGQSWTANSLPTGSTLTALALDPQRPTTLAAGTQDDGIILSTDGGTTWNAASGIPSATAVNALAFNPRNADQAIAATDAGPYESGDGGQTWTEISPRALGAFYAVAIDPKVGGRFVMGGESRIWNDDNDFFDTGVRVLSLLFDPSHPGTVLAGTKDGDVLFSSTNGGRSFTQLTTNFGSANGVLALATNPNGPLPTDPVPAPASAGPTLQYFPQTGHTVSDLFLDLYNRYGGLKIFGFPLTEAFTEHGRLVQYFERVRMVRVSADLGELSLLGKELTAGRNFSTIAPFKSTATRVYFPAAHHSLSGRFLTFWQRHTGSILFGPPISQPLYEQNGDGTGRTYLVQYFDTARMEYHPELAGTGNEVSLGQLGRQALQQRGWLQ